MAMTADQNDIALDRLFEAAQDAGAEPTPDFMARLTADMDASVPVSVPRQTAPALKTSWLAGIFTASGLSGAALAGLYIGFAMPETLDTFTLTSDDSIALSTFLPSTDLGAVFDE